MVIPSVIGGIEGLKKVKSAIEALGVAEQLLTARSLKASIANSGFSLSNIAISTSSKVAAVSVGLLKTALTNLTKVPVLATLTAIGAGLMYLNSQFEKSQEAASESFDRYNKAVEKENVDTSSFDAAYEKYKQTGVVSDELKESAANLAEELGIVNGQALISSENFEGLANSFAKAKEGAGGLTDELATNALANLDSNASRYTLFHDDFAHATMNANLDYFNM